MYARSWGRYTSERPRARRFGASLIPSRMRGFLGLGKILLVDPLQAVAGDVPVGVAHGRDYFRIRASAVAIPITVTGMPRGELAPAARSRRASRTRLDSTFMWRWTGRGARGDIDGKASEAQLAVQDRILAAFLEIDNELDGDACPARPASIGGVRP